MRAALKYLCVVLAVGGITAFGAEPLPDGADKTVRLAPYNVNAVFSSIRVRFVLGRQNLFDPQADPIAEARVVAVGALPDADETDLQVQDVLVGLNGAPLSGLTLHQLAALVAKARAEGNLVWEVRRGFETIEVLHNGDWQTPLPGLTR